MSTFLKPTVIVQTALGLLVRELTLPALVWRDPVGSFAGAFGDTISIRLPAFVTADERALRSGTARNKRALYERKVDLTLDTDIYLDVPITDEALSLDIANFGVQVLAPMTEAMGRKIEDKLVSAITGASYQNTIAYDISSDVAIGPYAKIGVGARKLLNNARVPMGGRSLVAGSELEALFLTDPQFIRADHIGASAEQTVREGFIGRIAGFNVYTSPAIPSDEGFAFHQTAYALSNFAPVVPAGAPYGHSDSYQGLALRTVRVFDPDAVEDRLIMDSWLGAATVPDEGRYDKDPASGGVFTPVTNPDAPVTGHTDEWLNDDQRLVRAVKITVQA